MARCIMGCEGGEYCEFCPAVTESVVGRGVKRPSPLLSAVEASAIQSPDLVKSVERDVSGGVVSIEYASGLCVSFDGVPFALEDSPCGWSSLDDAGECADLRALDGSLAVDAGTMASDAVHEFAESIETDVRYAVKQLRRADTGLDAVSRALDALERVLGAITGATCE